MSEGYTINDDDAFRICQNDWAAQTFTPVEDHKLWFCHLKLYGSPAHRWALMSIQTTSNGKPTGVILDEFPIWLDDLSQYSPGRLWRPTLHGAANLKKGVQYAIVISNGNMIGVDNVRWRYDTAGATYPRGHRLSSSDGGASWTPHPNSDHYFVEFGEPPTPTPPPAPTIWNFSILRVQQILTKTGFKIVTTTPVPSHAYMYWTTKEPDKHATPITVRGVVWKYAIQYCFVNWTRNEQEEEGDTLHHTFIKEPWPGCETRWFTFRVTVDGEWSPSVGPIFKKHRFAPEWWQIIFEPWTVHKELPPMTRVILEPWTLSFEPPLMTRIILEEWTS